MAKRLTFIYLGGLLIIGIWFRISGTLGGFFAFTFDQGRDFLQLQEIVYQRNLSFIGPPTGIDGVFHGVWWHWLLVPFFWLLSGDPTKLVLIFNLFSAATIPLVYFLGKSFIDQKIGLILATVVAISPFFISTSAQLWHPHVIPFLNLCLLISIWKYINKAWPYFPIALFLGLIFEFEVGYGGLFIPAFIFCSWLFRILPRKKDLIQSLLALGIWITPRALFEFKNNFLQTKSIIKYFLLTKNDLPSLILSERISDRFKTFASILGDAYAKNNDFILVMIIGACIFTVFSLRKINLDKKIIKFIVYCTSLIGLIFISANLYKNPLWSYYMIGIPVLFLPLLGLTIYRILQIPFKIGWIMAIVWLTYLFAPWQVLSKSNWEGDAAVYKNQIQVIDWVYREAKSQPFNVAVFSPSLIDYNYQYLFNWYGQKKYGYIPNRSEILPTIFFIVEPDPWNKGLRENWVREREGDGKSVKIQILPGQISVEKKIRDQLQIE